jgi:hypothetical protein
MSEISSPALISLGEPVRKECKRSPPDGRGPNQLDISLAIALIMLAPGTAGLLVVAIVGFAYKLGKDVGRSRC